MEESKQQEFNYLLNQSKEERGDMFEGVNNVFLHLKGDDKRYLKRQVKIWKKNKNIGALELFIHLYIACDGVIDAEMKDNKKLQTELSFLTTAENVSRKYHLKHIRWREEEIDKLEKQLDDVEKEKGYMKIDKHEELMKQQLEDQQVIIKDYGYQIAKYKKLATDYEYKCEKVSNRKDVQIAYLTKELDKLSKANVE
jgi:hypothetical protein